MAAAGSTSWGGATEDTTPGAVIIGHYGFRNLGDEAILAGMLKLLEEVYPEGRWTVVSGDPEDTRIRHGVAAVDRTDIPGVLAEAYRTGVVIVGGGGLLSDQWGFHPADVLSRSAGDIPGYLGPALAAATGGCQVLVWGVGVGPFLDPRSPDWAEALAEVASSFTVRTGADQKEMESLGVDSATVVADPAWLIVPEELPSELSRVISDLPRPLVAVAPRSWGAVPAQVDREREIAAGLTEFLTTHGGSALLVPMQELASKEFDDRACCERIAAQITGVPVEIAPPNLGVGQLITAFSRADLALNMRLHGMILAAMGRTPSVSVAYDPKVARLAGELGLDAWCVPDTEVAQGRLMQALETLWDSYPDYSVFMFLQSEQMRERAYQVKPALRAALFEGSETGALTEAETVSREMMLALTHNLSETLSDLDDSREENQKLGQQLMRSQEEIVQSRQETKYATQRGDLLQLELDNLRQTRAIRLITRYWRIRHQLRRRTKHLLTGTPTGDPTSDPTMPAIPTEVTQRIADSRGVVVFPLNIEWHIPLFQRPQQLAQAFARLGYTVVYDNSNQGEAGWEEIETRLFLYNGPPQVLHHLPEPLVWALTYNWPRASAYPEGTRILYDWIDELDVFDGYNLDKLQRLHSQALTEATVTSATARTLWERAAQQRPNTLYLPNGVEFERFSNWEVTPPAHPTLQRLLSQGRPIVGYYGAVARWMDYELLTHVAETRRDWSFLLIGPAYDKSARNRRLFSLPNVEWVTAQPYPDLPRWLQSFDVAMIPFLVNDITESTSPLKLFEYFAGGKPVVCSRMPEVIAFPEVRSYRDASEMSQALDLALVDSRDPQFRNRLRQRGKENSWFARAGAVAQLLEKDQQGG